MKKLLALLLVLSLLLVGCGGGKSETEVAGKVEPGTEAPTESDAAEAPAAAEETPVTMGRLEGGSYINEYAGYACDLDSSWTFYSAEELQELPENVKDLIAGTELGDTIDEVPQFTDMMAENVNEMVTVNVLYQKHTMEERLVYAMMSDEQILEETLKLKDTMIEAYAQAGMDVQSMEMITVNFLGQERAALKTVSDVQGMAQYTLQVFDYHLGQYSVTLTATSFIEDNTQWVLDQFYSVN